MEGLPEHLPIGQVTLKSYLSDLKIYLSRTTGRDFCRALSTTVSLETNPLACLWTRRFAACLLAWKMQKFSGSNQEPEWAWPLGTTLEEHFPQGLLVLPFFAHFFFPHSDFSSLRYLPLGLWGWHVISMNHYHDNILTYVCVWLLLGSYLKANLGMYSTQVLVNSY